MGGDDDWRVAGCRPEDIHDDPGSYWDEERIARFSRAKGQWKLQKRIAERAIAHFLEEDPKGLQHMTGSPIALDIGCGTGASSALLVENGCKTIAIDVIPAMLEYCFKDRSMVAMRHRGMLHALLASATAIPIRKERIDFAFSISALQWLRSDREKEAFIKDLHSCIHQDGGLAFQFYPRSRESAIKFGMRLKHAGFTGGIFIDNPRNPKKRKVFFGMIKRK
ncbi:methyltransferase domain-containing protein [Candidatus Bathyarchaeota archaeon]|nr:methyltransferase domain-containing protein [Candidatus Bathyarchaeota archaeon]